MKHQMKSFILIILLIKIILITTANSFAQTQKIDSLKAILSKTETDSTRFNLSIKILKRE